MGQVRLGLLLTLILTLTLTLTLALALTVTPGTRRIEAHLREVLIPQGHAILLTARPAALASEVKGQGSSHPCTYP